MKAYARFDEILTVGYFLYVLSILAVKFANLGPLWRHLYGDLFLFRIFKGKTMIAYANRGVFFKWTKFQMALLPCRIPYTMPLIP